MSNTKYIVSITKVQIVDTKKVEQMCIKEIPTDKTQDEKYGNKKEVVFEREYQPIEKIERKQYDTKVYEQTVDSIDMVAVINAVNAPPKADGAPCPATSSAPPQSSSPSGSPARPLPQWMTTCSG